MTSDKYYSLIPPYQDAMNQILSRLEILNHHSGQKEDFKPIHSMKNRIKEKESLEGKLRRLNRDESADEARDRLMDIAGVRVICFFEKDIRRLAVSLKRQNDLVVIVEKDYIKNPKPNGYRSYHLIVGVPVYSLEDMEYYPVEIQFRTIAMDFWASLEHKIYYKFEGNAPEYISRDLKECAELAAGLDAKMLALNEAIQKYQ